MSFYFKKAAKQKSVVIVFMIAVFLSLFVLFSGDIASAQTTATDTFGVGEVDDQIALAGTDIRLVIGKIIRAILGLLGILTVSIMMYGGYLIMTSGGSEEKVAQGRRVLINATIGLVIILSSFIIVQFIINALSGNIKGGGLGKIRGPDFQTFAGSGHLGRVIRDHYPEVDQTEVPRNTKIVITFATPIDPSSVIEDANGNDILGDCDEGVCDTVKVDGGEPVIQLYRTPTDDAEPVLLPMTALAVPEKNEYYTFVFVPTAPLGSNTEDIWHTALVTANVKKTNGDSLFEGQHTDSYPWQFQTNTAFDFAPPYVVGLYPKVGEHAPRNSIVQIHFNEPVDPTMVQGTYSTNTEFSNLIFGDTSVSGTWRIANGYRSVEFISSEACGVNSCGDLMYCLPPQAAARVLARTANLTNPLSDAEDQFVAVPFSGVMDLAGNALDGNDNKSAQGKPPVPGEHDMRSIAEEELDAEGFILPDHFSWTFVIDNEIDRIPPYLERTHPGIDAEGVTPSEPLHMIFSKLMRLSTLEDVFLSEFRQDLAGIEDVAPIGFSHRSEIIENPDGDQTDLELKHRIFGPNGIDYYYFPQIPSTVTGVNQNCFYPGRGPDPGAPPTINGVKPVCDAEYSSDGKLLSEVDCVDVTFEKEKDTACVTANDSGVPLLSGNIEKCIEKLELESEN